MPRSKRPAPLAPRDPPVRPGLPHERDESTGNTADEVDPTIRQAYEDIVQGQVDTDMRATPGLDAKRRRRIVPDTH